MLLTACSLNRVGGVDNSLENYMTSNNRSESTSTHCCGECYSIKDAGEIEDKTIDFEVIQLDIDPNDLSYTR